MGNSPSVNVYFPRVKSVDCSLSVEHLIAHNSSKLLNIENEREDEEVERRGKRGGVGGVV